MSVAFSREAEFEFECKDHGTYASYGEVCAGAGFADDPGCPECGLTEEGEFGPVALAARKRANTMRKQLGMPLLPRLQAATERAEA